LGMKVFNAMVARMQAAPSKMGKGGQPYRPVMAMTPLKSAKKRSLPM